MIQKTNINKEKHGKNDKNNFKEEKNFKECDNIIIPDDKEEKSNLKNICYKILIHYFIC